MRDAVLYLTKESRWIRRSLAKFLLILGCGLGFASTAMAESAPSVVFLSLADIHFDPFMVCYASKQKPCPFILRLKNAPVKQWPALFAAADQPKPAYRKDTGYPLLVASLAAAKAAADKNHVQFVWVLGDFLGHHLKKSYRQYAQDKSPEGYALFVNKTLAFVSGEVNKAFPSIDVYPVIGNNDTASSDYHMVPNGGFLEDTKDTWLPFIKNPANRASFSATFPYAGYYAVTVPGDQALKIIVLNSVLFSYKSRGVAVDEAASQQLRWFNQQLQTAADQHQKVFIAMHVPTGIDIYASLRIRLFTLISLWHPRYAAEFKASLARYGNVIEGVFSGHLHSDWFQLYSINNDHAIAMTGTPSISPIFGNDPSFKIYRYNLSTGTLQDYYTYTLPLEESDKFDRTFQPNCHNCSVIEGVRVLQY